VGAEGRTRHPEEDLPPAAELFPPNGGGASIPSARLEAVTSPVQARGESIGEPAGAAPPRLFPARVGDPDEIGTQLATLTPPSLPDLGTAGYGTVGATRR
jgi:hypothetical protein